MHTAQVIKWVNCCYKNIFHPHNEVIFPPNHFNFLELLCVLNDLQWLGVPSDWAYIHTQNVECTIHMHTPIMRVVIELFSFGPTHPGLRVDHMLFTSL